MMRFNSRISKTFFSLLLLALLTSWPIVSATYYPGAIWDPADPANYTTSNRESTYDITYIVIHVAQGSYQGCINWFKNPAAQASSHYVVSKYGDICAMVRDEDIAWHAGNWDYNCHSIGIEHEGYVSDPNSFTPDMYQASADLCKWLCSQYGIQMVHPTGIAPADPTTATGIIGHDQVPDPNDPSQGGGSGHHTDPGQYWDWNYFMSLMADNVPPQINVLTPSPSEVVHGTINIQADVSDTSGVQWVRMQIDNGPWNWDSTPPHEWTNDTSWLSTGWHQITVQAKDNAVNYGWGNVSIYVAKYWQKNLHQGWNLVSIPLILTDNSTAVVLSSLSANVDKVMAYDPLDTNDHWKTWSPSKPDYLNDLRELSLGFWANVTGSANLEVYGIERTVTQIQLYKGWNLVSYPSVNSSRNVTEVFGSLPYLHVQGYDPSEPYLLRELGASEIVSPGFAYWVELSCDSVWTVYN